MQLTTDRTHKLIQDCLAKNFSITQIAQVLGVTPSAVSQQISAYNLANSSSASELLEDLDSLLDSTEHKIICQLANTNVSSLNPLQLGKLLQQVNGAKRRASQVGPAPVGGANVTATLVLPQFILNQHVVINERNELKEVGGTLLESLPSQQVKELFGASNEKLPTGNTSAYSSNSPASSQQVDDLLEGL